MAMAASVRQPTPSPFTGCGNCTSSKSDRGELASETVMATIDAQPTTERVVRAHEKTEPERPESATRTVDPISAGMVNVRAAPAEVNPADLGFTSLSDDNNDRVSTPQSSGGNTTQSVTVNTPPSPLRCGWDGLSLDRFPNEILMQILGFLDVSDLLATSRVSRRAYTCV
jgi:hypothetical protein